MKSFSFLLLATLTACNSHPESPETAIAAASNLSEVFGAIGPRFESVTGIHPVFSYGATAQLTQQIENGAPFDLFAAADITHVEQLQRRGLLAAGSRATYATGILALWFPRLPSRDLRSPGIHVIAVANPSLAPYGQAAVETLHAMNIWDAVAPKIVYSNSIGMAKQYGASGNADAVFTALSLVLREKGTVIPIEENLHRPLDQALGILAGSKNRDAARRFRDFLLTGEGREILQRFGYRAPNTKVPTR